MATAAQIAANKQNALKSTGPKTVEGKEAARRNALKHGLTGTGIVIPGEDQHEVAIRVTALEAQMVPEGDYMAGLLVRQFAIASIRVERAYRLETALAAERMRRAADIFDNDRLVLVEEMVSQISLDPISVRRRLLMAPEGVDALLRCLRALHVRSQPGCDDQWNGSDGRDLNHYMGHVVDRLPTTRVGFLTWGIAYDSWTGLDPAEFAGLDGVERRVWAMAEINNIIVAEIAALEAHRATIDLTPIAISRAEAAERTVVDLGKEGQTLRRYAGAAERTMLKVARELRIMRYETELRAKTPEEAATQLETIVTEMPPLQDIVDELGPFFVPARPQPKRGKRPDLESIFTEPKSSTLTISIGKPPLKPVPPAP